MADDWPDAHLISRGWPPQALRVVAASGCTIRLQDGRELLDGASGALAATLGYGAPEVTEAIITQARQLQFVHSGHLSAETTERYAAELAQVLPGQGDEHLGQMMFASSGTAAIELAVAFAYRVQVARGQPARRLLIGRHLSYHGGSLGTLALGARERLRTLVDPLLGVVVHLPPPYPYRPEWNARFPEPVAGVPGLDAVLERDLSAAERQRAQADPAAALEVAIEALGPERICAFVAEPIIGASGGAIVPDEGYWPAVRRICDRYGVLWIADEVMTGMGRAGRWLACEEWQVVPDIVAMGKGLSGGAVPLSAMVVRQQHWEAVRQVAPGFPFGRTFANHPLAAAAGRAVLRTLREHDLLTRARQIQQRLAAGLQEAIGEHRYVGQIRGRGALMGVELVQDRTSRSPFPRQIDATGQVLQAAEALGVLLYPVRGCADGIRGDGFLAAPPLIASDEQLDRIVQAVVQAVGRLAASR